MAFRAACVFVGVTVLLSCAPSAATQAQEKEILSWVADALQPIGVQGDESTSDLRSLGEMIGNARIVVIGEGAHGAAQPLVFRNRLFRYLVEEMNFSAIAIESGTVESRVVQEYVAGGIGDIDDVITRGLSWTLDDFPQNKSLIAWMRSRNVSRSADYKLTFWGFDVPGSPGNRFALRGVQTAFDAAIAYVRQVDKDEADRIENHIGHVLPLDVFTFGLLPQQDRDAVAATALQLSELLVSHESRYVAASSRDEFEWGRVAAAGAKQVAEWLRPIPLQWIPENGFAWTEQSLEARHRAMGDNLEWILDRLGEGKRLLIFAALPHVATTTLTRSDSERTQVPAGIFLKRRFGRELFTIGNIVSDGQVGNCPRGRLMTLNPPPPTSLSYLLSRAGVPEFVLDLRTPPPDVADYFGRPTDLWNGYVTMSMMVDDAFDAAYFSGPLLPACADEHN